MSKFSAMFLMGMLVIFAACSSPEPDTELPIQVVPAPADSVPTAVPAPEAAV
jgi:putative hemolysin